MIKMPPKNPIILSVIIALLLISTILVWSGESSARPLYFQQTWPSRTPTPPSNPPTDTPPGGQPTSEPPGGPGDGTATPPGAEGSATPDTDLTPIALAPTPIGGYFPTAEPCGVPPTVQSLGSVNVREGPGLDYELVDILVYLEVRPLVGRAADAAWWLIELPDRSQGWVFDQAVIVAGYTGNVAIVEAPTVDDNTPTPGSPWKPTPDPSCTPLPTPTSTPISSVTPTAHVTGVVPVTDTATAESPTATETQPPTATASPVPSETHVPTVALESAQPTPASTIASEESGSIDEQGSSALSWFLIGGVGLIAAGLVISLARRRSS